MASRKISELVNELQQNAEQVLNYCEQQGVDLLIYCTYRSPQEQARLYRQSRTSAQVQKKIDSLRNRGFAELADILSQVGPQQGKLGAHVTFAGPGESWHNFRRAFDAVPLIGGKAMWEKRHPHWQIYGAGARNAGLEWAGDWKKFKEYPHTQLASGGNPLKVLRPDEVKAMVQQL
jgi:peptidoglycan L-alanyl-D-glutamate endopeptidase CwlK